MMMHSILHLFIEEHKDEKNSALLVREMIKVVYSVKPKCCIASC